MKINPYILLLERCSD